MIDIMNISYLLKKRKKKKRRRRFLVLVLILIGHENTLEDFYQTNGVRL